MKVEGAIERWGSLDIEVRTAVTHGEGMVLETSSLQIPEVRKLASEIKDLFVISPRRFEFQRLQGPKERPKAFSHLRNERRNVQPTGLEAPEVRDCAELLDIGLQVVCEEGDTWKGDRDVASVSEESALA